MLLFFFKEQGQWRGLPCREKNKQTNKQKNYENYIDSFDKILQNVVRCQQCWLLMCNLPIKVTSVFDLHIFNYYVLFQAIKYP